MHLFKQFSHSVLNRRRAIVSLTSIGLLTAGGLYSYELKRKEKLIPYSPSSTQTIKIAWPHYHENTLFNIANETGIFSENSLNILLCSNIKNHTDALSALKENNCDAAVLSPLDWIPSLASGLAAKLLVGMDGGNFRVFVTKKLKIERLSDLRNIKIGIRPQGNKEKLFLSILLRRKGINPEQNIQWTEINENELLPSLISNRVQAIISVDPVAWQMLSIANKQIYELAGSQTASWGGRINQVVGISELFLNNHPNAILPLISSIKQAAAWKQNHLKDTGLLLSEKLRPMSNQEVLTMLHHQNHNFAPINNKLWEQIAQYLDEFKLLNLFPYSLNSAKTAKKFCHNINFSPLP